MSSLEEQLDEACLIICGLMKAKGTPQEMIVIIKKLIDDASDIEREECAKIAELYVEKAWSAQDIAADIRLRGETKP